MKHELLPRIMLHKPQGEQDVFTHVYYTLYTQPKAQKSKLNISQLLRIKSVAIAIAKISIMTLT